jgi:hypothetical protein
MEIYFLAVFGSALNFHKEHNNKLPYGKILVYKCYNAGIQMI